MMHFQEIQSFSDRPNICIFGDKNFPDKSSGKPIQERREALRKLELLLLQIQPRKVYIIPERGFNLTALSLLNYLNIPYVLVNPHEGYFDSLQEKEKLKMSLSLENSDTVITIGKPPKSITEEYELQSEVYDFMLSYTDFVISIYGKNGQDKADFLRGKVDKHDQSAVFINYSLFHE